MVQLHPRRAGGLLGTVLSSRQKSAVASLCDPSKPFLGEAVGDAMWLLRGQLSQPAQVFRTVVCSGPCSVACRWRTQGLERP